ncbi:pyridoxal phosphatase [Dictyobacter vulcani]|uniref:Pyridoxal phosphatase n=1 Tax=Dictyobacter vulcani TaxID=2607529 RepID=A0A5J4KQE5_9CHLR|nr:Cof-type HAD-IIB family hydrolase [Dictyobacter vulcani]GER88650.1 pyridoxal phosphatase [Dictyobacter vulcani]
MITQPEAIKMIAIDIDGTLLTPQKRIAPRTLDAIQAAQAAGMVVTLATARRYENSRQFADRLGIQIPLITCDGALILDHPDGTVLHRRLLPADLAHQAVEILVAHQIQPVIHHINGGVEETWSGHIEFDNLGLEGYFKEFPRVQRMHHHQLCLEQPDPVRVVAFATEEAIERVAPAISQLPCAWNSIKRGNYGTAEITVMQQNCSKATAVALLATHLGISMTHVMAIGDNNNDLEMIEAAGWGVAMGRHRNT